VPTPYCRRDTEIRSLREGFNGATLSRTWKPLTIFTSSIVFAICFNGATLSRTWKLFIVDAVAAGDVGLQWSHAQSNVETPKAGRKSAQPQSASMEPRSVERGNNLSCAAQAATSDASMEPRSVERGNTSGSTTIAVLMPLQWSHAQSNVETTRRRQAIRDYRPLQWSHAQSNVETICLRSEPRAFEELQWSHAQSNVETPNKNTTKR